MQLNKVSSSSSPVFNSSLGSTLVLISVPKAEASSRSGSSSSPSPEPPDEGKLKLKGLLEELEVVPNVKLNGLLLSLESEVELAELNPLKENAP